MEWVASGVWGDQGMPEVEELEAPIRGFWTYDVDISGAIEELEKIRGGQILWSAVVPEHSAIEILYSLNGGLSYRSIGKSKRENGQSQAMNDLHNDMNLKIRVVLHSAVADIFPNSKPVLKDILIILSDRPMLKPVIEQYDADQVLIWDKDRTLKAVLPGYVASYNRAINQVTQITVKVVEEYGKEKEIDEFLKIASLVQVYRGGLLKATGRISGRSHGNEITLNALSEEVLLEQYLTPAQYGLVYEGWDIAAVARDLLFGWETLRVTDLSQWQDRVIEQYQVDLFTDPGRVLLEKKPNGQYHSEGYIILSFSKDEIENFMQWDRIRWSADSQEPVYTSISYKRDDESWQGPYDGGIPEEVGWAIGSNAETVLIRIDLKTDDTETLDSEDNPVGVTPYVFAVELIARTAGEIAEGEIPEFADAQVSGVNADYSTALEVLKSVCEQEGFEFSVWNNRLNLNREIGKDRTKEFIFRAGTNMAVKTHKSTDESLVNTIIAVGSGSGINRPQIKLSDQDSIEKYGVYLKRVDFDTGTIEGLEEQAQVYLDLHKEPRKHFEISALFDRGKEPEVSLGDKVIVVDPETETILTSRIMEESGQISSAGVKQSYFIGAPRRSLASEIKPKIAKKETLLEKPSGVFVLNLVLMLRIGCAKPKNEEAWDYTEFHASADPNFTPSASTLKRSGRVNSVTLVGVSSKLYFKLVHVDKKGRKTEPSKAVTALF